LIWSQPSKLPMSNSHEYRLIATRSGRALKNLQAITAHCLLRINPRINDNRLAASLLVV